MTPEIKIDFSLFEIGPVIYGDYTEQSKRKYYKLYSGSEKLGRRVSKEILNRTLNPKAKESGRAKSEAVYTRTVKEQA